MPDPTREELIQICEDAIRLEVVWHDRDSEGAHRQLGECWALLKAGCEFVIDHNFAPEFKKTHWVRIRSKGFKFFDEGGPLREDHFYIPTRERLEKVQEGDWY